jgi:hypothetical protein
LIHTNLFFVSPVFPRNKRELLLTIERVQTGIALAEIKDCYESIESDVTAMIIGGEIIAISNKDKKTFILFPRGVPFYSQLTGTVTAYQGKQNIDISDDIRGEIRRGEAIKVGEYWYRVSCAVGSGSIHEQTQKSTAPLSVTLDKEMSADNIYTQSYSATSLPLDGDFDMGTNHTPASSSSSSSTATKNVLKVKAIKHGCTNDIKELWRKTYEEIKPFLGDTENDYQLQQELVKHGLIKSTMLSSASERKNKVGVKKEKKKRQVRKQREFHISGDSLGVNAHLKGTAIEKILKETREKLNNQQK